MGVRGGARLVLSQVLSEDRYYATMLPAALNVFSMQGFVILNCIIGGQTLASVSSHLDDTLGIVIISLISLAVSLATLRRSHFTALN